MEKTVPSIFEYSNYRTYLRDYYQQRKIWDPGFTHTYICFRLGQKNSRTLFNNIVSGRKDLTTVFIDRFIELLELNEDEIDFFRSLVLYNQSTDVNEKEFYFENLLRKASTPQRQLSEEEYTYYTEWHHSAVRALLEIYEFNGDYKALGKKLVPNITAEEAKESVKLLKELKLIQKDDNGTLRPSDRAISTSKEIQSRLIHKYHLKALDQCKMAIMSENKDAYKISTHTLSVSENGFQKILKRSSEYNNEIIAIVNQDEAPAEKLYQVTLQLVALSN